MMSHVVIRCSNVGQTVVVEWRASISISSRFMQSYRSSSGRVTGAFAMFHNCATAGAETQALARAQAVANVVAL